MDGVILELPYGCFRVFSPFLSNKHRLGGFFFIFEDGLSKLIPYIQDHITEVCSTLFICYVHVQYFVCLFHSLSVQKRASFSGLRVQRLQPDSPSIIVLLRAGLGSRGNPRQQLFPYLYIARLGITADKNSRAGTFKKNVVDPGDGLAWYLHLQQTGL